MADQTGKVTPHNKRTNRSVQDEIPKSRLTIRYRTEIEGEPASVELPLRLLVMGDLSKGSSKDRKLELDERRIRGLSKLENLDGILKDMEISTDFVVPNKIDPENSEDMRVKIDIDSMKAFTPDEIAKKVPKLQSLLLLRKLLLEVKSNVANKKEFRMLLTKLYEDEGAFKKAMEELKGFESFRLPKRAEEK